ncbi:hypothetical protein ALC60_01202 [Trachymyrmex zeteki]|uniref:Uncharacterized protein n=1 Tax=Mycetomoellerius zeteki TaxID=64791 RepID=A0A151XHI3_9HYME|nr:hypothetical protein ALC60_01202 [Trachymyrmex zeteki]
MCFAGYFRVSRSILGMPTFREHCSSFYQGEEQPDTELFLRGVPFILRRFLDRELQCSRNVSIPRMDLNTEITRIMHSLYNLKQYLLIIIIDNGNFFSSLCFATNFR